MRKVLAIGGRASAWLFPKRWASHKVVLLALLLGLLHGLLFVFLVPPWQHYDEPSHFEYAWLIARRGHLPQNGEYDQEMRREVAASMLEFDFFEGLAFRPNLLARDEPAWIGVSQIGDRPLYHILVSLPLRLVPYSDVTFQLYLGRLTSLLLYLITLLAAWGTTIELTAEGHPLRGMVPLTLALLPGFTDLMTSLSNDVGAVVSFSLFLWVSLRLLKRGFSWLRLLGLFASAALCFWTSNTASIAVGLSVIPLSFSLSRDRRRWMGWAGLGLMLFVFLAASLAWGDAAYWYPQSFFDFSSRLETSTAPLGAYALRTPLHPGESAPRLIQLIPAEVCRQLRGKTVTLGAWMWADQPTKARTPILDDPDNDESAFQWVEVGVEPTFVTFRASIHARARRLQIILSPQPLREEVDVAVVVYYDGIVLAEGEYPLDASPQYADQSGRGGEWGGRPFVNILRGGSAEAGWLRLRPWADEFISREMPLRLSLVLYGLLNPAAALWYYRDAFRNLSNTFWGKFGWGHVPLFGYHPYLILGFIALMGIGGAGWAGLQKLRKGRGKPFPWDSTLFLGATLIAVWGAAFMRGIASILGGQFFIPSARYADPAIIPTVLLLNWGWLEVANLISASLHLPPKVLRIGYVLFLLGLDGLAWVSIARFYPP